MQERERGPERYPVTSREPGRMQVLGRRPGEESRIGLVRIWCEAGRRRSEVSARRGPWAAPRARAKA